MIRRRARSHHLRGEDLIAVEDGYLTGRRRERVYGHLATCQACQARLREYREVGELIRRRSPRPAADPDRRAALMAQIQARAARRRWPWFWRPLLVSAVTVLVLIATTVLPSVSEADSLLGDFVRFGQIEVKESFEEPKPLAVPTLTSGISTSMPDSAFSIVEPATLPLGFEIAAREAPTPLLFTLYFQNDAGDSLMLNQEPAKTGRATIDSKEPADIVTFHDRSVLLVGDPRPGIVSAMFWDRDGIGFGLLVVDEPSGGLLRQDALAIVDAIMVAQDVSRLEGT